MKFYFDKYKQGDINSTKFRTSLVDTFVRKIVLSDDFSEKYLDIYCNASTENIRIPLEDFSSSKGNLYCVIKTDVIAVVCRHPTGNERKNGFYPLRLVLFTFQNIYCF